MLSPFQLSQAAVLLAFPSLQLPNVVFTSPGDGPEMCHVLMPAQKWQKDVPLTQYVMSQWMDDVAIGPAVVGIVVLTGVKGEVDVAGGNDAAGLVPQVVVAERRRKVERTDLRDRKSVV